MISLELYKRILDSGLILDHYHVLCNLRDGKELPKSKRVDGFINLLNKKGYIEDGALTDKAFDIIDVQPIMIVKREEVETPRFDFGTWVTELYDKCQSKMTEMIGKPQITAKINKTDRYGWPFLPNAIDFTSRMYTTIQKYRLNDMDAIERVILKHIENCASSNKWFPLMKYYINKKGEGSQMVTDIENGIDETVATGQSAQKFV